MRILRLFSILSILLFTFAAPPGFSATTDAAISNSAQPKEIRLQVDFFLSSTCPHCKKMDEFIKDYAAKNTWVDLRTHVISDSKEALETYAGFLKSLNLNDFAVPALFFCNTRWVGFSNETKSRNLLIQGLEYCHKQIVKQGKLTQHTIQAIDEWSVASRYQERFKLDMPDLALIPTMALIDALNPETAVLILSLFCFLLIEKRKSLQRLSGLLFLLGVGFAHYFQQMHMTAFYELVSMLRIPTALVGLGLLTYLFAFHPKIFAKERALPAVLTTVWLFITGIAVQTYQQLHSPNFSLLFQQWLVDQNLSMSKLCWYLLYYHLVYLIIIGATATLLLYIARNYGKWSRHQLVVDEFGWQYLMVIGLFLVLHPYWMACEWFAITSFLMALVSSWICYKILYKKE